MTSQTLTAIKEIAGARLASQRIADPKGTSAHVVVSWMGAIQAQDFEGVKWAIGLRKRMATESEINAAYNKGEILRTHLLRPTWQMVAREDLGWMLDLTSSSIKKRYIPRNRYLGLTNQIFMQSEKVIQRTLETKGDSTREELITELSKAQIATDENRASHLLANAELDGLICSGALRDGKITYTLLENRIPKTTRLSKEEALASLAKRYFLSRSPATLDDFKWWSGLSIKDSRIGIEAVRSEFESMEIEGKQYWVSKSELIPVNPGSINLLPAFDEFTISYADRGASLPNAQQIKAVSNNGIFRPTVVLDGQVIGIWKSTDKMDAIQVEVILFVDIPQLEKLIFEKAGQRFGEFKRKRIEILFTHK